MVLFANGDKITVNNTLDERLKLISKQVSNQASLVMSDQDTKRSSHIWILYSEQTSVVIIIKMRTAVSFTCIHI